MEIVVLAEISSLNIHEAKTSSDRFEINFVNSISPYFSRVVVLSSIVKIEEIIGNVWIIPVQRKNHFVVDYKSYLQNNPVEYLLFWGYNPSTLKQCLACKQKGTKVIPFVFDTHLGAIPKKGLKRFLLNAYYQRGIRLLKKVNGIILFQESAYSLLKLDIPFLVSAVPATMKEKKKQEKSNGKFCVVYSSTINEYNGFIHFPDIVRWIYETDKDIEFHIYGDGSLYEEIKERTKGCPNLRLYGRVRSEVVEKAIREADLVLNLRDPNSIVNKFAFPSKVVEYLEYGKLILTTKFIDNPFLYECTCAIDTFTAGGIATTIVEIKQNYSRYLKKTSNIQEYLERFHHLEKETLRIIKFIEGL